MQRRILVTCGLIERDGNYLIVQRGGTSRHALKWEFPGGKLESGETLEICMARELKEELTIDVLVHQRLESVIRLDGELILELVPFFCTIVGGKIRLLEHLNMAWVDVKKPIVQKLCAGDYLIAKQLAAHNPKENYGTP